MGLVALVALLATLPLALCLNNTLAQTPTVGPRCLHTLDRWLLGYSMLTERQCASLHGDSCVSRASPWASLRVVPLQMGFNTWNAFGPDIDEQLVLQTAGFLNNLTLSKLGYNLIVLDGASSDLAESSGDLGAVLGSCRPPDTPDRAKRYYSFDCLHSIAL